VNCPITWTICGPSNQQSGDCSTYGGSASWNVAAGTFSCGAFAYYSGGGASLITTARYAITNLPAGTPVVVRARLRVDGTAEPLCSGVCDGYGSNTINVTGPGPGGSWSGYEFNGTVTIDFLFEGVAGDPFEVTCDFSCQADWVGFASVNATLEFTEVPPGAIMSPCQTPPVAVGDPKNPGFGLRLLGPNPSRGRFAVGFSLPTDAPASLAVFDVAGRIVGNPDLGRSRAGLHTAHFGDADPLPPGVYLVRLMQAGRSATRRAIVTR